MPKLQRHTQKIGGKTYNKWVAVIPEEVVKKAGFKKGDELEVECNSKGKITIHKG